MSRVSFLSSPSWFSRFSLVVATAGSLLAIAEAGCRATDADADGGASAACETPGTAGIADYSFGANECGIHGPTPPGTISIFARVKTGVHRQLALSVADSSARLAYSGDSCTCGDPFDGGTYSSCAVDAGDGVDGGCTAAFYNDVSATLDAQSPGFVTVQLTDADSNAVLEQFTFEVQPVASIPVGVTAGASSPRTLTADADGVYQVHLSDSPIHLTPTLKTADGRDLVTGGGSSGLSATFSDSKILSADPTAEGSGIGVALNGVGDGTVTLTYGAIATTLALHVSD